MTRPANRPAGGAGPRGVQSVATAMDLIDCLAAERELGVAEIGRRLGIAKSSAHRLLTTLAAKGYVQQVPETRDYRLGQRLHELGALVASRNQLRDHALPLLEALRAQTGETAHLAVPEGAQMFYVERLESYHGLRFSSRVSRVRPIHLTSSGKAVAAFNPEVARRQSPPVSCRGRPGASRAGSSSSAAWPRPGGGATPTRSARTSPVSHRSRPRCLIHRGCPGGDLSGRAGRPHPERTWPGGPPGQGGRQPAHERRNRLVERLRLPLTWFARAERRSPARNRRFPFRASSLIMAESVGRVGELPNLEGRA